MKTENKRSIYRKERMLLGTVVGLSITLCAFEYRTFEVRPHQWTYDINKIDTNDIIRPVRILEKEQEKNEEKIDNKPKPSDLILIKNDDPLVIDSSIVDKIEDTAYTTVNSFDLLPTPEVAPPVPFFMVEIYPEFIGGIKAREAYLQKSIRYPQAAINRGAEGMVNVAFVLNTDGTIDKSSVIAVTRADPDLVKEAIRVISAMPAWKPGFQQGHAVRVQMQYPIVFKLAK